MTDAPVVLREGDPRAVPLMSDGWRVAHRSWAARLGSPIDRSALHDVVQHARAQGYRIHEALSGSDRGIAVLEAANRADYPGGPVTAPSVHTVEALAAARADGMRYFAAFQAGVVIAVTAIRAEGTHAETEFTSVARDHRRLGLAEAVKAASVLALAEEGAMLFGTGGAEENAASLAMNARLGYSITERWLTLSPPLR